ncbi:MAG TPA: RICIN domain-containing protein, partial [Planctomycetota bacterium]|nr:RICIN domain-containing protein [Planctomycetota bacterium]
PANLGADAFPSSFNGCFFFSDYCGWIKYIDSANFGMCLNFATNINRPIDVEIAPDGSLWYIARAGQGGGSDADNSATTNGSLWRVRWTGGGGPSKLVFSVQPASSGSKTIIAPTIKIAVQNTSGNTVTSATNTIAIAIANNPASGTMSGTLSVAAVNGVATFANLSLNNAGNGYTLRATSGSLSVATSAGFNVTAQATKPVISPNGGSFSGPVWVQLSSATPGANIRYTTDGATPTGSSATYSNPFQLTASKTVKAIAQKSGLSDSAVASVTITITGSTAYGMDYRPVVTGVTMPTSVGGSLPGTLSGTGLFSTTSTLATKAGIVPYSVNSALWSDNAQKQRWVALPGTATITFAATGEYSWPGGTIFIKHFDLVINEVTKAKRRLKTRVLVLDGSGDNGYGVTYKWRSDKSEADLVAGGGEDESITITTSGGSRTQVWHYPSRDQCLQCHTVNAGFVLGPKTRQLNGAYAYPTGRSDNQVRTWSYLQMFTTQVNEDAIAGYQHTVKVDDTTATLENRVRSYLDANCAHCHRPGGTGAQWDARYDTPLASQNIINGAMRETFGISGAKVVAPADVPKSIMHLRMQSTVATQQMPPLARNVVDSTAVSALAQWIGTLPPGSGGGGPQSGGVYRLTAKHSGKRLEIIDDGAGSISKDGTKAQQWSARNGGTNQDWRLDHMGGGWWKMTNVASGKVLDVPASSTANSVQIGQFTDKAGTNQRWSLTDVGGGWFTITAQVSDKNLDVDGASTVDGAQIHQYQDNGGDNQRWSFTLVNAPSDEPLSGALYSITAKHSGKALDVFDDGSGVINQNGTYVQQWTDRGATNQQWRLDDQGGGWWKLTNVRSGKCLDVPGSSTANSVALNQWSDNGGDNQRWSFIATGGGYYKIGSKVSGKYLDVASASTADGARIHQYQDNGADNQRWMLEMVAPATVARRSVGDGQTLARMAAAP